MQLTIVDSIPQCDSMDLPSPEVIEILKKVQHGSMGTISENESMDPPTQEVREVLQKFRFKNQKNDKNMSSSKSCFYEI